MKTICITGATGFLGKHLTAKLAGNDSYTLRLLSRNAISSEYANITYIQGDLLDAKTFDNFITPDSIVIHLAYIEERAFSQNKIVLTNLINACKKYNVKHFIHVSTAVVVGRVEDKTLTEDTICNPRTPYELNKLACEQILVKNLADAMPLSILRPTAIFGDGGKNLNKLIDDFLEDSYIKKYVRLFFLGRKKLHLVHVDKIVNFIQVLVERPLFKNNCYCYNITDDLEPSNNYLELYKILSELTQSQDAELPFYLPIWLQKIIYRLKRNSIINPEQIFISTKSNNNCSDTSQSFDKALRAYIKQYLIKG